MSDALDHSEIGPEVQGFLCDKIRSYEHLEAFLLLRSQAPQAFSCNAVAQSLKVKPDLAADVLDQLCEEGLVVRSGGPDSGFQYGPTDPSLARLADRFVDAYENDRVGVMSLMNKNAMQRVRGDALRRFADAFVISGRGTKR